MGQMFQSGRVTVNVVSLLCLTLELNNRPKGRRMILNQIGKTFLIILCVNDFNMRSITSEIYFRDLNWIQEKQKNEPKKKKNIKNKNPISSTHFKAWERGWFFLIKRISLSIKIWKILARWANIHFCVNKKKQQKKKHAFERNYQRSV